MKRTISAMVGKGSVTLLLARVTEPELEIIQ